MHTMLDKQSREEAIAKRKARDSMTCADIPPTNPGNKQYSKKIKCQLCSLLYPALVHMLFNTVPATSTTSTKPKRNASKCKMCKQPMKVSHKNVASCPRNKTKVALHCTWNVYNGWADPVLAS